MVLSSDESSDEAIPEQANTQPQRKRHETFIANGKRYIRGVKGMKIGRYIPYYDAYLVQEIPQGLPVVEINYARETTWTVVSVRTWMKQKLSSMGYEGVRIQRSAIDLLCRKKNLRLMEGAALACKAALKYQGKGWTLTYTHVKTAQLLLNLYCPDTGT
jgi:hypothetical protein